MSMIKKMAEIRYLEQTLLDMFSSGRLFGTTHTCIGQEACACALYSHLDPAKDLIFSHHRCHGHFLAFGGSPEDLLAEVLGKQTGVCAGRGGSQHLCNGAFFSQGVQGQSFPIAVGAAYWKKQRREPGIVVAHLGDGTLGQGIVYESLNMASLLSVPLLVVMENNGMAQSTETIHTTAGSIIERFAAFGIGTDRRKADDPFELESHLKEVVDFVRTGRPFVQVLDTFRLMAHSKGDDDRPAEVVNCAWGEDWLERRRRQGDPAVLEAFREAKNRIDSAMHGLESVPPAKMGAVDVFVPPPAPWLSSSVDIAARPDQSATRVNKLLNSALDHLLETDDSLQILGEDLVDPYGGAFKVTRGLSTKYGDRVMSTPISEAAIVGFANGWSLAGGTAVVEIMFGDFATLAAEQLINQAAKMHFMYNGQVNLAMTVRLVSGGYRGYGATHSQSLEKIFCGIPGLKVVALSRRHDPVRLLAAAVRDPNPVIFVENKTLYSQFPAAEPPLGFTFHECGVANAGSYPPLFYRSSEKTRDAITVVTYGGLTELVETALVELILQEEMDFDYFVLTGLNDRIAPELAASVRKTRRILVVEEGSFPFGIGSEIVAQLAGTAPGLKAARVGALSVPIPGARHLEEDVLPSATRIREAVLALAHQAAASVS